MCSIIGYCGKPFRYKDFSEGFARTVSRGPDDTQIITAGQGVLGFHRLSIMGLHPEGMQPFQLHGNALVCNGEIYGFEKFRKELEGEHTFVSDSDCEVLLPLYEKYGVDMFSMLDAEFACILYDGKKDQFVAARDPIGIRPLYYGYDDNGTIIFASEPKNLVHLTEKILPFPPGHYYCDGKFTCYCDIAAVAEYHSHDLETVCDNIREKLIAGVEKRLVADAKVGFLLSGGLDSSLVCAIAARKSRSPIRTFAIGMSEDAIDLKYAKQVSDYIGSDHTEVIISQKDVLAALEPVVELLGTFDITTIRASIGMYLVCKYIHENTDIRVLLTGEISDELFGYKVKGIILQYARKLGPAIGIKGLFNIQFIVDEKDAVYIIEVNPRSSRTVPFLSKATGYPLADIATLVALGHSLKEQGIFDLYPEEKRRWYVKAPAFSFSKLRGLDAYLSPEMKSTGEAIGYDEKLHRAMYKAMTASGMKLQNYGTVLVTLADEDKEEALPLVRRFYEMGFNIEATTVTAAFFKAHGIRTRTLHKLSEGSQDVLDAIRSGYVSYVINTRAILSGVHYEDGVAIRRCAVENGVTMLTALDTVRVLLDVLEEITLGISTIDA